MYGWVVVCESNWENFLDDIQADGGYILVVVLEIGTAVPVAVTLLTRIFTCLVSDPHPYQYPTSSYFPAIGNAKVPLILLSELDDADKLTVTSASPSARSQNFGLSHGLSKSSLAVCGPSDSTASASAAASLMGPKSTSKRTPGATSSETPWETSFVNDCKFFNESGRGTK
jgi:hypothetical protein